MGPSPPQVLPSEIQPESLHLPADDWEMSLWHREVVLNRPEGQNVLVQHLQDDHRQGPENRREVLHHDGPPRRSPPRHPSCRLPTSWFPTQGHLVGQNPSCLELYQASLREVG